MYQNPSVYLYCETFLTPSSELIYVLVIDDSFVVAEAITVTSIPTSVSGIPKNEGFLIRQPSCHSIALLHKGLVVEYC